MTDPITSDPIDHLAPVLADEERRHAGAWTERLVLFLRIMAGVSMLKGLYHWAAVCGFIGAADGGFFGHNPQWQTATIFFAVLDPVAAVGLWLAAPWGAVVWLTSVISMAAVVVLFPQIYGASMLVVLFELSLLGTYLWLVLQAAREQTE